VVVGWLGHSVSWPRPNILQQTCIAGLVKHLSLLYWMHSTAMDIVTIAGATLPISKEIRFLGVIIDMRLTFESPNAAVVKTCNYHLWALQHICHLLPFSTALTTACSLVLSGSDYCNVVLNGCSARVINWLQHVQNYAAHVVTQSDRFASSQPLLQSLRIASTAATGLQSGIVTPH